MALIPVSEAQARMFALKAPMPIDTKSELCVPVIKDGDVVLVDELRG